MALSKIDTTNMIEDVPQSKLDNNINFRNIIINGDMSIAQRATSVAGVVSGGYRVHDRWRGGGTIPGTWTWSQSTDVPSGQGFSSSMKWDCTTADASLSASDTFAIQHRIEAQNLQYLKKGTSSAESVTLSFWVKSNKTGTYICELEDSDNTRHISKSYTINSANTWEKKTITYEGDTTGTLNNDNGTGFQLQFWLAAGTDSTSGTLQTTWAASVQANTAVGQVNLADSTSNEWYITGVQLEAGTTASDFEFLPHDVNLLRCQRYYEKSNNLSLFPSDTNADGYYLSNMTRASSNQNYFTVFYKARKRVEATVTIYSYNTGASGKYRDGTNAVDYDASVGRSGEINFVMRPTSSTGVSLGDVMGFQWEASSEL